MVLSEEFWASGVLSDKAVYILNEMLMSEELTERINKLLEQEADEYIHELPWWEKDEDEWGKDYNDEMWGYDDDEDE